jgi:hypothetical protein
MKLERLLGSMKPAPKLPAHVAKGEACGFACHWSNTAPDYYQWALKNHIMLRVNVLQDAVMGLLRTMSNLDGEDRFQLGLYSFDAHFHALHPLSPDLGSIARAVPNIVPDITDCTAQCADTSLRAALHELAAADAGLPRGGDNVPQRFVFIVTDGVQDDDAAGGPAIRPVASNDCDAMKFLGFTVMVLYTPYPEMPGNALYQQAVAPLAGRIMPALQACASSANYVFQANDPSDIISQMQNMLRLALRTVSHPMN